MFRGRAGPTQARASLRLALTARARCSATRLHAQRPLATWAKHRLDSAAPSAASPKATAVPSPRSWADAPFDAAPALDANGRVPVSPYDHAPLPGTAPEMSTHLVLVPKDTARAPETWPSHIDAVCPLFSELASRTREGGSLAGYGLSFSAGDAPLRPPSVAWDPRRDKAMRLPPNQDAEDESFWLYAYRTPGLCVRMPVSLRTLPGSDELRDALEARFTRDAALDDETHIFVCTHGTRDCRCGVAGTELLDALRALVDEHKRTCAAQGSRPAKRVRVLPISHVGGHKWAANALVYPHGDWYGNLRVTDAPLLLRAALAPASSRYDLDDLRERLVLWPRWRGRLGMKSLEMHEHMGLWGPPVVYTAQITPRARGGDTVRRQNIADIVPLRFRTVDGAWHEVEGRLGETLMQVCKRHDLPGIEATCGGNLECATCHAYLCDGSGAGRGNVDSAPVADALPGLSDEEDDMLEYAVQRKGASRLMCQIPVTRGLSKWMQRGGRVELTPY